MSDLVALSRRLDRLMVAVTNQQKASEDSTALKLITLSLIQDLASIGDDGTFDQAPIVDAYTPEQAAIVSRFSQRHHAAEAKARLLQELAEREEDIYEQS